MEEMEPIVVGLCELDIMKPDREDFYKLIYGFVQGLYKSENYPVETGCAICRDVAMPFANMQNGIALIMELATDLFSDDSFGDMPTSDRLKKLYSAFMFFWEFAVNFDALF
jgi:hypothetical protein